MIDSYLMAAASDYLSFRESFHVAAATLTPLGTVVEAPHQLLVLK